MNISGIVSKSDTRRGYTSERAVKSMSSEIPHSIQMTYFNLKPRSYFATPPSTKVIFTRPATGSNLGPGKYRVARHSPTPSFEFGRTPRFSESDSLNSILFKRLTEKEKEKINDRIEKNKEIAMIPPAVKLQKAQELAIKHAARGKVTRVTKEYIYKERQSQKLSILNEKFRKYEYRVNIDVRYI